MVEVTDKKPKLLDKAGKKTEPIGLLIHDEVTGDVLYLELPLEDVFNRSRWGAVELPSVVLQQKKRA